jgi:putative glutamine amidotransferase
MANIPTTPLPIVVLPSCQRTHESHPVHQAGRKYVDAVRLAGALPLVAPPCNEAELEALLAVADGVLLTGSPSNVHPSHFGEAVLDPSLPLDEARDALTLPLIRAVLARGIPLLAICRGTQEVNVALGGSLHQAVHTLPGRLDHRGPEGRDPDVPNEVAYGPCHPVQVQPGGALAAATGRSRFIVNSLHGQAVNRLAPGLRVEALADDGTIEAFSLPGAPGFNLCLQWHPEWQAANNPVSMELLQAFGAAVRTYQRQRQAAEPKPNLSTT